MLAMEVGSSWSQLDRATNCLQCRAVALLAGICCSEAAEPEDVVGCCGNSEGGRVSSLGVSVLGQQRSCQQHEQRRAVGFGAQRRADKLLGFIWAAEFEQRRGAHAAVAPTSGIGPLSIGTKPVGRH